MSKVKETVESFVFGTSSQENVTPPNSKTTGNVMVQTNLNKKKSLTSWLESYTKRMMTVILFVALVDMQLSYVLAFMGRETIAETLSSTIADVIVGATTGYLAKSLFETLFSEIIKLSRDARGIPDTNPPTGDCLDTFASEATEEDSTTTESSDDDDFTDI